MGELVRVDEFDQILDDTFRLIQVMHDDVMRVLVARAEEVFGGFYLSFVELCLNEKLFRSDDWGWIEGMIDWAPLEEVIKIARSRCGKKNLATTNQRKYLHSKGFAPWKGMSNREASVIIESTWEASLLPVGWWIADPISDSQISRLKEIGIGYESRKATLKQVAYLSYMGVKNAQELTAVAASQLIDEMLLDVSIEAEASIRHRQSQWQLDRYKLYPDLYAKELARHQEMIVENQCENLRQFVRKKITAGSRVLTKNKIIKTIRTLQEENADWAQCENYKELFLSRLSELFPDCVDGNPKT